MQGQHGGWGISRTVWVREELAETARTAVSNSINLVSIGIVSCFRGSSDRSQWNRVEAVRVVGYAGIYRIILLSPHVFGNQNRSRSIDPEERSASENAGR